MPNFLSPFVSILTLLFLVSSGCDDVSTAERGRGPLNRAEMRQAVDEALRITDTVERYARIAELADGLTTENVAGATDIFDSEIAWIRENDLLPFVHAWTKIDGEAAFQHVVQWAMASKRAFGVAEVTYYWALIGETPQARTYAESLEKPALAEAALAGLARGWAENGDLEGLAVYLGRLTPGNARDHMVRVANGIILRNYGLSRLKSWVDAMPPEGMNGIRTRAFRTGLSQVAFKDPQFAAAWFAEFKDEPFATNTVSAVATAWLERDAIEAMTWLHELPPSDDVDTAVRHAVQRWLRLDPREFEMWLLSAEWSPVMDSTLRQYALHLAKREPSRAIVWTSKIESSDLRQQTLIKIVSSWQRKDSKAARAWIEAAELSSDLRERLLETLNEPARPARRNSAS